MSKFMSRRFVIPVVLLVVIAVAAVGLYLFQPWRIFTSSTVTEGIPSSAPTSVPSSIPSSSSSAVATTAAAIAPTPAAPLELASGELISHEHASSGSVRILQLPDGRRILRFEGLDTSDGPDLKVWLSDAPVIEGTAGWHLFDDGGYLSLGALKANKGDQNYEIPPETVLGDYSSVSIWCARFAVSFAAAELKF
ncbi:DM13 domain-containing protein [Arthrobacter sp. HLT1-20]